MHTCRHSQDVKTNLSIYCYTSLHCMMGRGDKIHFTVDMVTESKFIFTQSEYNAKINDNLIIAVHNPMQYQIACMGLRY